MRRLILVLGDQLDAHSAAFDDFDPAQDALWMAEVAGEATKVWSSKPRIAVFLAAMRHFREERRALGWRVDYHELGAHSDFTAALTASVRALKPSELVMVEAGEWAVQQAFATAAQKLGLPLEVREDRHFFCSRADFARHASGRKQLRMEFFYRELRRRTGVLMDGDQPVGGQWNYDADNREAFGRDGPGLLPAPRRFAPDALTREVLDEVNRRFADHPGDLAAFDWPVTAAQARGALADFIAHRLADFGRYQDALWEGEPWLYHSRLSAAMNLKLLDPREVVAAAEQAWREGRAPLAAAEGFIRQILGWREYVRGVYWRFMPEYVDRNALGATAPLPDFYWTGDTEWACLRDALGQTLRLGYAHHIQRLMVTGLFGLMLGVDPRRMHEWYLAVYVDAVEWVELPNTLGMSQYADGGVMASKPYVATGKYLQRMGNHCAHCRCDPGQSTGPRACPFTTLYWDFLLRHEPHLRGNPRLTMQLRNLTRLEADKRATIQGEAAALRQRLQPVASPA